MELECGWRILTDETGEPYLCLPGRQCGAPVQYGRPPVRGWDLLVERWLDAHGPPRGKVVADHLFVAAYEAHWRWTCPEEIHWVVGRCGHGYEILCGRRDYGLKRDAEERDCPDCEVSWHREAW